MKRVHIKSKNRMSSQQYLCNGKPLWWARVGFGKDEIFLNISEVRGDSYLDRIIVVEDDVTKIHIGVGSSKNRGIRETVIISDL